jgi:hydroxymethylbilane synthase
MITTKGDTVWDTPLHLIGGKGLFVREIEEELLAGSIDMAVHSMKDLPTELEPGLVLSATLEREDPRDALLSLRNARFSDMGPGARIGTNSLRRKAQILHANPSLEVVPLRGNVDTRIRKMEELGLDGIVLACAGVKRMGFQAFISEILPLHMMVPASGQGAIGIETREDGEFGDFLKEINHEQTFREVTMERALQRAIGGSCQVPLGIYASVDQDRVTLEVAFGSEDGSFLIRESLGGPWGKREDLTDQILLRLQKQGVTTRNS